MRIIVIEDERPAAEKLQAAIKSCNSNVQLLAVLGSVQASVEWLQQNPLPDLIFMDIQLTDGVSFKIFDIVKINCPVIFITAYTQYAVDAFDTEAVDYLVKPVTFDRFMKAVQRLAPNRNDPPGLTTVDITDIFLKVDRRLVRLPLSDILYVEGFGDYLKVHTSARTYVTYMTMTKLESLLPASKFIRIHRSTIVNTHHIKYIEGNFVKLNELELSIGQTYKDSLVKRLG